MTRKKKDSQPFIRTRTRERDRAERQSRESSEEEPWVLFVNAFSFIRPRVAGGRQFASKKPRQFQVHPQTQEGSRGGGEGKRKAKACSLPPSLHPQHNTLEGEMGAKVKGSTFQVAKKNARDGMMTQRAAADHVLRAGSGDVAALDASAVPLRHHRAPHRESVMQIRVAKMDTGHGSVCRGETPDGLR